MTDRELVITRAFEDEDGNPQLEVLNTVTFAELGGKTKLTLQAPLSKQKRSQATRMSV